MMIHNGGTDADEAESYTVYHKLTNLCAEIETAIKNGSRKSRDDVQSQIMRIRSEAFTMTSPEAEYALRLFRYFLEDISEGGSGGGFGDNMSLADEVPPMLYEGHPDQLSGPAAMKKNIFWMRVVVGALSFISFVIMACVPNFSKRNVGASDLFDNENCNLAFKGHFSYVPYHYVLASCVLIFIHSLVTILYYLLPVDSLNRKYIPGMEDSILTRIVRREQILEASNKTAVFCQDFSKMIEFSVDVFLFCMLLIACISASSAIEQLVAMPSAMEFQGIDIYYSLKSFSETFSLSSPVCIQSNPVPVIRGALAMAWLALFAFGFALQVSMRSFLRQRQKREGFLFSLDESSTSSATREVNGEKSLSSSDNAITV